MVKVVSVRESRLYGPHQTRGVYEQMNAVAYLCATILILVGVILLFYRIDFPGWIILLVALVIIILVNLHDMWAHLAGLDFSISLLMYDPQLALIEMAAPLINIIGGILFVIGVSEILQSSGGKEFLDITRYGKVKAIHLFMAGSAFWLLGSVQNAFQVYERSSLWVQTFQKGVAIPFIIASTLFLVSSVFRFECRQVFSATKVQHTVGALVIVACLLLLVAAIVNVIIVLGLQSIDRRGGPLEKLRGGANERLVSARESRRPFLETRTLIAEPESYTYKEAVIR